MTFESDLAVRVAHAEPAWDVTAEWPEIERVDPRLPALVSALRAGVPVLREVRGFHHQRYVRPPTHRRSFYVTLDPGVLAVKGSEPLSLGYASFVDEMATWKVHLECRLGTPAVDTTIARAELSGLEKFPILEGKVPGCVTLREALADAEAGLAVQRAHVDRYGEPARLPLPLFVGRWPDEVAAEVLAQLRPRLRGRAREVVERSAGAGLGVYAYYYPSVPHRLDALPIGDPGGRLTPRDRLREIARHLDPRAIVDGWIGLTARLLALGFVPKDPLTLVSGDCLQMQNAVLDGGFADVESLVAARLLDDRALRDAVRRTVHELALTATRLLLGLTVSTVEMRDRLPDIYTVVWNGVGERLRAESPRDERIAAILLPAAGAYDALAALLDHAF